MTGEIRLNKQGLADLIENIKNNGGDTTELDNLMAMVVEDENARRKWYDDLWKEKKGERRET